MELSEQLYKQVEKFSKQGDRAMDKEDYPKAIEFFQQALAVLPEPKVQWEAYSWLLVSIGDAYYMMDEAEESFEFFRRAYTEGEMVDNPFVLLRLGQNCCDMEEEDKAVEFLLRAYMLEGEDIFEDEEEYLEWLAERVDLEKVDGEREDEE